MKHIVISILCSFLIITPFFVFLLTVISTIKMYVERITPKSSLFYDQNLKEINRSGTECNEASYNRIEYLKNYLRPPREQVLEEFRKLAIKEKIIFTLQSQSLKYILMLALLIALLFPEDTQYRFLQRTSIYNAFFRSENPLDWLKSLNSSQHFCNWLEYDFIDGLYGDEQCLNQHLQCGITSSTGCILVGKSVMRIFEKPSCGPHSPSDNCYRYLSPTNLTVDDYLHYEPRLLKGIYGTYYQEDELVIFNDNKLDAQDDIYHLVPYLLNITSRAVSIELLLFNPSFSTFMSVTFLFEISGSKILFTNEILPIKWHQGKSVLYHFNFALHLIFLLITLVGIKNQCWRILKHRKLFWLKSWNYFSIVFNAISVVYLVVYVIYTIEFKYVVLKLEETHLSSHLNLLSIAYFEMLSQYLLAFLIFLHLVASFQVLYFSPRLKELLKRITKAGKIIASTFFTLLLLISICDLILRFFVGRSEKLSHPFVSCLKALSFVFGAYTRPDIVSNDHCLNKFISIVVVFIIISFHVFFFAFMRSVFMNSKSSEQRIKEKNITFKEARKVIKKRLKECLQPKFPQIVEKGDHIPPVEFLLLELEQLADKLLTKANTLFGEKNICDNILIDSPLCSSNVEGYLKSHCELLEKETSKIVNKFSCSEPQKWSPKFTSEFHEQIEAEVAERLNATMPRQAKPCTKSHLPSSLNASLASQRKFKYQSGNVNLSASLQSHKIRKTYPLYQVDADASSGSTSEEEATYGISLRKTKSKGKGKKADLDLNVLDDASS